MKKVGIVFICIVLFFASAPVFIAFNFQRTFGSSPENIKAILVKINAYERLTNIKASDLIELLQPENRDTQSQIPEDNIQKMIDSITPETAQKLIEQGLDGFYKSLKTGGSSFDLDLRELKQATLATQQPEVTAELNKNIPDTYTVNFGAQSLSTYSTKTSNIFMYLGLAIYALLALIAILLGSGLKGKLSTTGTVFLTPAVALLLVYFCSSLIPFDEIKGNGDNTISQEAFAVFRDFIKEIWGTISLTLRNQGLIALAVSITAYIVAIIIPGKKNEVIATAPVLK